MELNLELLMEYLTKMKQTATISIDLDNPNEAMLTVQRGKYRDNSSLRVFVSFEDLQQILLLNNITGSKGKIKAEKTIVENSEDPARGKLLEEFEKSTEKSIYGTLAKYLTQMLSASMGEDYFPEIKCLKKHDTYFRR